MSYVVPEKNTLLKFFIFLRCIKMVSVHVILVQIAFFINMLPRFIHISSLREVHSYSVLFSFCDYLGFSIFSFFFCDEHRLSEHFHVCLPKHI